MLSRKQKELIKKSKREKLYFISMKSSILSTIRVPVILFFVTAVISYMEIDPSVPMVIMCAISSALVYLIMAKDLFGSVFLCMKLDLIYMKIKFNKLIPLIFRK